MEICFLFELPGWADILQIVCRKLDFRDLLRLNRTSKIFKEFTENEIIRREKIRTFSFFDNTQIWFLGRRCAGFKFEAYFKVSLRKRQVKHSKSKERFIEIECRKFEEIVIYGEYRLCRSCLKRRESLEQEQEILKIQFHLEEVERRKLREEEHKLMKLKIEEEKKKEAKKRDEYIAKHRLQGVIMPQRGYHGKIIRTKNASEL